MGAAHATFVIPRALARAGKPTDTPGAMEDPFSLDFILKELAAKYDESVERAG